MLNAVNASKQCFQAGLERFQRCLDGRRGGGGLLCGHQGPWLHDPGREPRIFKSLQDLCPIVSSPGGLLVGAVFSRYLEVGDARCHQQDAATVARHL